MKTNGYILLVVLIFLQIFSMLGLLELENARHLLKLITLDWQKQAGLIHMQKILQKIEAQTLMQIPYCLIPIEASSLLIKKPLTWWMATACQENLANTTYYYVVENLGVDECAQIKTNEKLIADYYRITLLNVFDLALHNQIILQSTIIKPENSLISCAYTIHSVNIGRQMWREIIDD